MRGHIAVFDTGLGSRALSSAKSPLWLRWHERLGLFRSYRYHSADVSSDDVDKTKFGFWLAIATRSHAVSWSRSRVGEWQDSGKEERWTRLSVW